MVTRFHLLENSQLVWVGLQTAAAACLQAGHRGLRLTASLMRSTFSGVLLTSVLILNLCSAFAPHIRMVLRIETFPLGRTLNRLRNGRWTTTQESPQMHDAQPTTAPRLLKMSACELWIASIPITPTTYSLISTVATTVRLFCRRPCTLNLKW